MYSATNLRPGILTIGSRRLMNIESTQLFYDPSFLVLFLFRKRRVEYHVSSGGLEKGEDGKIGQKERQTERCPGVTNIWVQVKLYSLRWFKKLGKLRMSGIRKIFKAAYSSSNQDLPKIIISSSLLIRDFKYSSLYPLYRANKSSCPSYTWGPLGENPPMISRMY